VKTGGHRLLSPESLYRSILEATGDAVLCVDPEGIVLFWSRAAEGLLGYTAAEVIGNPAATVIPKGQVAEFEAAVRQVLADGSLRGFRTVHRRKDGSTVPLEVSWGVLKGPDGAPAGVTAVFRDASDRVKAEERVKEQELRFRELTDILPESIFETDGSGRITFVNQASLGRYGYSRDEVGAGMSILDVLLPEDRDRARQNIGLLLTGREPGPNEYTAMRRDGSTFPIIVSSVPIIREGRVTGIRGFAIDISRQRNAERALKEILEGIADETGEAFFRALVRSLARAFGVDCALVAETVGDDRGRILAVWNGEGFGQQSSYDLRDTPCHEAFRRDGGCFYPTGVQAIFPGDPLLGMLSADGYQAAPLRDPSGAVIGILAIMSRSPLREIPHREELMRLFASRAAAELLRSRMERDLRQREELFRTIFRTNPDAVALFRLSDGAYLEVNDGFVNLTGYTAAEVLGKGNDLFTIWDDPGERDVFFGMLREQGVVRNLRGRFRRRDGAVRLGIVSGCVIDTGTKEQSVMVQARDVTDFEEAILARRDTEERYRILFNQGDDAIFVQKAGGPGRFVEVNDVACRRYGYTRDELLRMSPREIDAPEMAERIPLAMERLMRDGQALFETLHLTKDGRRIPVEINALVFEMEGEPAIFSMARDLTRRNEYEEALERSEQRFRSVVDSSPMGIHLYRLEPDGRLVFTGANPAADSMLQTENRGFIGKTIEEAFPPLADTEIPSRYKEVCRSGNPWHTEQITYEDNRIRGAFEVFAFRTSRDAMAVMFLDVTERRRLEQEALEARDRLISQMGTHEAFVSEVAHRLRNPLQILTGYLSVFPDGGSLSPEQWTALETLRTAVRRIEEDIKGLTP
jgi:PAS domain S-box-containing protein